MKIFLVMLLLFTAVGMNAKAGDLDAFIGYSFADELDQDGGDSETEAAFLLGVRYKDQLQRGFGWNVGFGLDTIRDIKSSNAEFGFFLLEGNATLHIDQIKALYIFAGLNYPMIVYEDKNMGDMDPVFGVQFGTGFNFTPVCGAELAFRTVNFEIGTADSNLWGFAVRGFYTFAGF
ncbi:MAG: hypothetical protein V4596_02065 [Bdellovibrionota bacterium]